MSVTLLSLIDSTKHAKDTGPSYGFTVMQLHAKIGSWPSSLLCVDEGGLYIKVSLNGL